MSRHEDTDFHEIEALIYRLFAEKQFAMALLALLMVANLMSAQFLLLRVRAPAAQATEAPDPSSRLDLSCIDGQLAEAGGAPPEAVGGRKVVLHLDASTSTCLTEALAAGADEVVVGVPATDLVRTR